MKRARAGEREPEKELARLVVGPVLARRQALVVKGRALSLGAYSCSLVALTEG